MSAANPMELTEKDCELLLEAIDAWEKAPTLEGGLGGIMTSLLSSMARRAGEPDDGSARREVDREMNGGKQKSEARRRISIMLRAKVELLRQSLQAAALKPAEGEVQS